MKRSGLHLGILNESLECGVLERISWVHASFLDVEDEGFSQGETSQSSLSHGTNVASKLANYFSVSHDV
jgi:hypothetical protein